MDKFKENGIYIKMNDLKQSGYFTMGKDGNLINHKYGLKDKLFDVYKYGKTLDINYSYIFLYNVCSGENGTQLYMGTRADEIPEILSSFQNFSPFSMGHNRVDCKVISGREIKYLDDKNRECSIKATKNGLSLILENFSFFDNAFNLGLYQYYPLLT